MDYATLVPLVRQLISATGRSVTFQRLSSTPSDPSKPWNGPGTPTVAESVVTAATFVPPSGDSFGKEFLSSELLSRCEQVCLTAPNVSMALSSATVILDAAQRWSVAWVYELKPGDTTLLFAFGVKR